MPLLFPVSPRGHCPVFRPARLYVSGEAKNGVPITGYWPPYRERRDRLVEAVDIIRRLWSSSDFFDYEGRFFQLKNAYLYLKPRSNIPILISATGPGVPG